MAGVAMLLAGCRHAATSDPGHRVTATRSGKTGRIETVLLPDNVPLKLVWIPAGTFLMGQRAGEQDAYPNKETPQHRVNISRGFWMGRTEVTKQQ